MEKWIGRHLSPQNSSKTLFLISRAFDSFLGQILDKPIFSNLDIMLDSIIVIENCSETRMFSQKVIESFDTFSISSFLFEKTITGFFLICFSRFSDFRREIPK